MEKYLVVLLGFLGLLSGISVEYPRKYKKWNVLDDHCIPWRSCTFTHAGYQNKAEFRAKYFKVLSAQQVNPNWQEIHEILNFILKLHPDESYLINNKELLGRYVCRGGSKIINYLKKAGRTEKFILNFLRVMFRDLFDKKGYDIKKILHHFKSTKSKFYLDSLLGANFEHKCIKIMEYEDPFHFKSDVVRPRASQPRILISKRRSENAPKLKVIQITDINLDEKLGTDCDSPVCCRKGNVPRNNKAFRARKFGSWKCDTPGSIFGSFLNHIRETHPNVDYILWTGNAVAHRYENRYYEDDSSALMKTFDGVTVYPTVGHFSPLKLTWFKEKNRVYNLLKLQWGRWLPEKAKAIARRYGYYTTLIRPGLRLVSFNTNFCSKLNRMSVGKNADLRWLVSTLKKAEKNKEKVHIIGHIPPSSPQCAISWRMVYYKIINRFESTVTAQFFGHSRGDGFQLFYDMRDASRPVGVAYLESSFTSYSNHDPSYKVHFIKGDYKHTQRYELDRETWYTDLKNVNEENLRPRGKFYVTKRKYELESLYPVDLQNFYKNLKKNKNHRAKNYFNNF